jgi:hypothetical protein
MGAKVWAAWDTVDSLEATANSGSNFWDRDFAMTHTPGLGFPYMRHIAPRHISEDATSMVCRLTLGPSFRPGDSSVPG